MERFFRRRTATRLRAAVAAAGLAASAVSGACGEAPASIQAGGMVRDDLRRAVETTLAAKSFTMHVRIDGEPDASGEGIIVYQAPDRLRSTGSAGVLDTIIVGRTMYSAPPPDQPVLAPPLPDGTVTPPFPPYPDGVTADSLLPPSGHVPVESQLLPPPLGGFPVLPRGSFWRLEVPATEPPPVEGFLSQLRLVATASEVERVGSTYHYRAGTSRRAVSGDAHVEDGRLVQFTFQSADPEFKDLITTFRIADFNTAPPIEPPPDDKVSDAPALKPCGPDGTPQPGDMICGDTRFG